MKNHCFVLKFGLVLFLLLHAVHLKRKKSTKPKQKVSVITNDNKNTFVNYSNANQILYHTSPKNDALADAMRRLFGQVRQVRNHSYSEMYWFLKYYNETCQNSRAHLYSIGKSVQNRDIWVMALGSNPGEHTPGLPEVKLVGNVHGNEYIGRELLLYLVQFVCDGLSSHDYKQHQYITNILRNVRLHILPSLNPDGYEMFQNTKFDDSKSLLDESTITGRLNANGVDINRNFPDQFFPSANDIEPETQAVIDWLKNTPFVLSASLHNGAMVVSYPYDDSPSGQTKYSATPDDDVFRAISQIYSQNHPHMSNPNSDLCLLNNNNNQKTTTKNRFVGGVTNGADWSSISNSMQDYNYVYSNCFEVTVELTCEKNLNSLQLFNTIQDNVKPLLEFVNQANIGIRGFVFDENNNPLPNATITLSDRKHQVQTAADGDYYRLLLPGNYQVTASFRGYTPATSPITVSPNSFQQINFTLFPKLQDLTLLTLGHLNKLKNTFSFAQDGRETQLEPAIENLQGPKTEGGSGPNPQFQNGDTLKAAASELRVGQSVECRIQGKKNQTLSGEIKWIGRIPELAGKIPSDDAGGPRIVGIRLERVDELATDGTFLGRRYFEVEPKHAYFVPVKNCLGSSVH